jgi:hypothetical protein
MARKKGSKGPKKAAKPKTAEQKAVAQLKAQARREKSGEACKKRYRSHFSPLRLMKNGTLKVKNTHTLGNVTYKRVKSREERLANRKPGPIGGWAALSARIQANKRPAAQVFVSPLSDIPSSTGRMKKKVAVPLLGGVNNINRTLKAGQGKPSQAQVEKALKILAADQMEVF